MLSGGPDNQRGAGRFAELINRAPDTEKDEIVIYYRLAVLAEAVVLRYSADTKEKI